MLAAVMHIIRLVMKLQIIVNSREIPVNASIGVVLIAGVLGIWMFAAAKQK
jgi:hypothetical protein